jgi:hypothetical protein
VQLRPVALTATVGLLGLTLGVLTAYGQEWLPQEVRSLANSSGSWALAAFLLALLATGPRVAAACGALALLALLAGYVLGAGLRGYPSGSALIVFWGLATVFVGPFLGLGAHWVRSGRRTLAALGAGGMGGVLVGEGVYGLAYIADTTYPPYWWGQILLGLLIVLAVMVRRLARHGDRALGLGICALTAIAFVAAYSQGSTLLGLLS